MPIDVFVVATAISGLIGLVSAVPLGWRRRGGIEAVFSWSRETLVLRSDGETTVVPFEDLQELVLRARGCWTLEIDASSRGAVLLWQGAADPDDTDAPPFALLVELARALRLPWRCER